MGKIIFKKLLQIWLALLRKDNYFKTLPVGKLVDILALLSPFTFFKYIRGQYFTEFMNMSFEKVSYFQWFLEEFSNFVSPAWCSSNLVSFLRLENIFILGKLPSLETLPCSETLGKQFITARVHLKLIIKYFYNGWLNPCCLKAENNSF